MKKVELQIDTSDDDYNQIYQQIDVKFSFLKRINGKKDSFRELFPKVLCRDYLSDCVAASILGESEIHGIYGFNLSGMIETSELLMSVSVVSKQCFINGLATLRNIEREFKDLQTPITFYETNTSNTYVIVADKAWLKSSLTISIFTLLIRCINHNTPLFRKFENLFDHIDDNYSGNDQIYIDSLKPLDIRRVLSNIDEILGSDPAVGFPIKILNSKSIFDTSGGDGCILEYFHNNSGIVSFVKGVQQLSNKGTLCTFIGKKWIENYHKVLNIQITEQNVHGVKAGDVVNVKYKNLTETIEAVILYITYDAIFYAIDTEKVNNAYNYSYHTETNILEIK